MPARAVANELLDITPVKPDGLTKLDARQRRSVEASRVR